MSKVDFIDRSTSRTIADMRTVLANRNRALTIRSAATCVLRLLTRFWFAETGFVTEL